MIDNNRIERILFWFKDGEVPLNQLTSKYFGLATLLKNLINLRYTGKKIKFVNLNFSSKRTFELYPGVAENHVHYYRGQGGHLAFYGVLNFHDFNALNEDEKTHFLWEEAHRVLSICAKSTKNDSLLEANDFAYRRGIETNFNTNYQLMEREIVLYGCTLKASIWIQFKNDGMEAYFTLEDNGKLRFKKFIDDAALGAEFFLEMFKAIIVEGDTIVIKGSWDADVLPMYISIDRDLIL
ncbi:hypothetical protein [Pedobacter sp. FW305-3-2-15-E-R2A2]|uniref:hypothetical protein n=1 Tax=Pedobacter sp. FW305-3-2-15-E-R2A2 TaxID=3140251 RepID=UPI003140285D